ncbi:hypothetical protein CAPTEDRAFT_199084 [Capitella teleta]|uniref:Alpha-1,4-N-acetylglucosaminyltransferase n=1 Tax=Capitella teleta TaxID=283909 RepID=R7UVJ0_CAPTE|nr:hypothetical protein CAPTEDRAFT_199084 [Capitella teleta]|eukprot:ELU07411.1 hypothetical protein CAPTEDRAFT_199084 [Capitella teleta]
MRCSQPTPTKRRILALGLVCLFTLSLHHVWTKHGIHIPWSSVLQRHDVELVVQKLSKSNDSVEMYVSSTTTTTSKVPAAWISLLESEDHVRSSQNEIPKIIHQFWDAPGVPKAFAGNIKTWTKKHPKWEYWFWQASDVRLFLSTCFPEYVQLYKKYPVTVNRADAMRYFVLFAFGGLYLDLDMVAIKANDDLLNGHPCVLTEETYEHSIILYERVKHPNLINAYMACHPAHPLFRMAIKDLPKSRAERDHLRRTGPFFLDHIYHVYNSTNLNKTGHELTILHPNMVMPTYDKGQASVLRRKCMTSRNKPAAFNKACRSFQNRKMGNQVFPESYANHLWTHTYMAERRWKSSPSLKITDIVPKAVNVTRRILRMCTRNGS